MYSDDDSASDVESYGPYQGFDRGFEETGTAYSQGRGCGGGCGETGSEWQEWREDLYARWDGSVGGDLKGLAWMGARASKRNSVQGNGGGRAGAIVTLVQPVEWVACLLGRKDRFTSFSELVLPFMIGRYPKHTGDAGPGSFHGLIARRRKLIEHSTRDSTKRTFASCSDIRESI